MRHAIVHWFWRHSWGWHELHHNRLTRRTFNALDQLHARFSSHEEIALLIEGAMRRWQLEHPDQELEVVLFGDDQEGQE